MTRPNSRSRVTVSPEDTSEVQEFEEYKIPTLRQRRPIIFWAVVIGSIAMVLSMASSFFLLLSN